MPRRSATGCAVAVFKGCAIIAAIIADMASATRVVASAAPVAACTAAIAARESSLPGRTTGPHATVDAWPMLDEETGWKDPVTDPMLAGGDVMGP